MYGQVASARPSCNPRFRTAGARGRSSAWSEQREAERWEAETRSRSPCRDAGASDAEVKVEEAAEDWENNSFVPDVPDTDSNQSWDAGGATDVKAEEPAEDWENNSWAPDAADANWSQSCDTEGEGTVPAKEEAEEPAEETQNNLETDGVPEADWSQNDWSQNDWSQKWDDGGWSRKRKESWSDEKEWSWKSSEEGWNGDWWRDSWSRKSKDGNDDRKRSRKADVPAVLYAQAYISDIPVEFDEKMVRSMHKECGVDRDDLPISVKFLPSKDKTGETCACIARYAKPETLEWVLNTMHGKQLKTRSGKIKTVGVKRARPAKWMVQAGLAQDPDESQEHQGYSKVNAQTDDVVVAPKQVLDEWVEHEGTIMQWYSSQASGYIRTIDGVDLYAQSHWFSNLDAREELEIGRRVAFEAKWRQDKYRYDARNIRLLKPTEHFPMELPDGPQIPVPEVPQQHESVPGLDYFCIMWNLNAATVRWLQKLHPDVQERLINEYDDSFTLNPQPGEEVQLHVSSSVAVGGLHSGITEEVLWKLFSGYGEVKNCRFLGATAVIEMETKEEALLAVQDMMVSTDWPGALVAYFYHALPPVGIGELPEGQRIFGIVKKWDRKTSCGFIAVNGIGPDLPITLAALEDVVTLIQGAPVLFVVQHKLHMTKGGKGHSVSAMIERCMGDREAVRQHVSAGFGTECAVRNWARHLQHELKMGSPDI